MENRTIKLIFASLILIIGFSACDRCKPEPEEKKDKTDFYEEMRYDNFLFFILGEVHKSAVSISELNENLKANPEIGLDSLYSIVDFPKKMTLTYNESDITGIITAIFTSYWSDSTNATAEVSFEDFTFKGKAANGRFYITKDLEPSIDSLIRIGTDSVEMKPIYDTIWKTIPRFNMEVDNLYFNYENNDLSYYSASKEIIWTKGYENNIIDNTDVFNERGTSNGISPSGDWFTSEIIDTLRRDACPWISTGIIRMNTEKNGSYQVEFGDGISCDNEAYIKYGDSYNIFELEDF